MRGLETSEETNKPGGGGFRISERGRKNAVKAKKMSQ